MLVDNRPVELVSLGAELGILVSLVLRTIVIKRIGLLLAGVIAGLLRDWVIAGLLLAGVITGLLGTVVPEPIFAVVSVVVLEDV